ncbi:hypothetical protein VSH64_25010 [Amycolatopsis rhabdoformis]|uniref:AraC family transcriptional regulator n=1 Tax=Amycolatopsis rhabdoformis TaxID=1448059 RepID=A0ABZ1HXN5_9PSEU|nr:hypothetical protein [Amycolatopsis rhabdoformis]WSE26138.1 hypothetical protein VSH64_25010 [Amycolatopsis rhabdoformis]
MNSFDMMHRIVEHAKAWGLDVDGLSRLTFHAPRPQLRLRDFEYALFQDWARHLVYPLVSATDTGLVVVGQLMSGHAVTVSVRALPADLKAYGLHGVIALGHVAVLVEHQRGTRVTA